MIFGALADPSRRAIVEQLLDGPRAVGELRLPHPIGASTLSKHLTVLTHAGLLTQQANGRRRICRVQSATLRELANWVDRNRRAIQSQRAALEKLFGV